jgi:hypothetical protein
LGRYFKTGCLSIFNRCFQILSDIFYDSIL